MKLQQSQFFTLHTTLSDSEFEKAKNVVASEIESEFDKQTIFQNNHPGLNSTQFFEVLEGAKVGLNSDKSQNFHFLVLVNFHF